MPSAVCHLSGQRTCFDNRGISCELGAWWTKSVNSSTYWCSNAVVRGYQVSDILYCDISEENPPSFGGINVTVRRRIASTIGMVNGITIIIMKTWYREAAQHIPDYRHENVLFNSCITYSTILEKTPL